MTMKFTQALLLMLAALATTACTTLSSVAPSANFEPGAKWALLPMVNQTDTPQAGLSAEAIAEHGLRLRGLRDIARYPVALSRDSLFEPSERRVAEEAQKWAREQGIRYGLTGVVEEWRYKVGIDGEPAVGVTLQVLDLSNGQIIWSASGAKSGWSREALSGVAHKLLYQLLDSFPMQNALDKR
jgi:polysaccharide biosynthesis protein PelC